MEGSRRSAVREPGPKKPRLPDDSERDRERQPSREPSRGSGSSQSLNPRLRPGEREREDKDDSARSAGSYQELMAQYKTALAELTFNSKPIITNLTIIAGENQHVAKEITAIICANIVEVPSEQKLPSLYLLDSIVKNIGRDYVKYFAARLPEVFCKAYKQVDSSIHPSMRHLFGTWKGVFPSAALQIIEKELGFPTAINGSSGATASKTESQATQRQPHSIHVNPKYLEARQRLQQSSKKAKDTSGDDTSGGVNQVDDADMYARTAIVGSTRQRTEVPINKPNIQHPQREPLTDPIHEKKGYRDANDFSPDIPRQSSDLGVGRVSEKVKVRDGLDKPFHGAGAIASEISTNKRNDFDANNVYGAYRPSGSAQTDGQLPSLHLNNTNKSNRSTPNSWKNSEEEEFMWDDMNSRLADYGGSNSTIKGGRNSDTVDKSVSLQRGKWRPEHLDSQWNQFDTSRFRKTPGGEDRRPLFRDIEEHLPQPHGQQDPDPRINIETTAHPLSAGRTASGHHASLLWPPREPPPSAVSLNHFSSRIPSQSESRPIPHSGGFSLSSSLPRPGPLPPTIPSRGAPFFGPVGFFGQQRQQALQPPSPSARSPPAFMPIQHPRPHNSIDDHLHSNPLSQIGQKPVPLPGQWNRAPQAPLMQDSFPLLPQSHTQQSRTSLNSQPSHLLQTSVTSSASLAQMRHHLPLLQSSQPDLVQQQTQQSQPSVKTEKLPLSIGSHQTEGFSRTNLSNNNPIDVPGQSNTSNLLASIMKSGILSNNPSGSFQNLNVQPPLPSGPPPIQILTSSAPMVTPSSLTFSASHGKAPAPVPPPIRAMLPPLPPGPPPASSLVATTSEVSNTSSATLNPFSGLLSALLAKGIISSPATELPVVTSAQIPNKLPSQTSGLASSALVVTSAQIPNKLPNQTSGLVSSALALCPSTSATSTIPPAPVKKLDIPESSAPTTTELGKLVGFDFKPESIREFHPLVINSLFDDLTHQCNVCGLRFRLQEQLDNHLDWHVSKKSEMANFERVSRQWFADKINWVDGSVGPPCGPMAMTFLEDVAHGGEKCEEPMVPADESQSICALCGEPFEDVYSDEMDEWMYKGTVYLNSTRKLGDAGSTDETLGPGPIVHAKCVSSSVDNIEVNGDNKEG